MKGTIIRRGKSSWRLKFDIGHDASGNRQIRYLTVRGKRQDAERELSKQLNSFHQGTSVEPSKITVADYMRGHLDRLIVSPKTLERYRELTEQQIIPHLGAFVLQKLRPAHVEEWHSILLQRGGKNSKPLSARTVGHAHRVLHGALVKATATETVSRNVASFIHPPKIETEEVEIYRRPKLLM